MLLMYNIKSKQCFTTSLFTVRMNVNVYRSNKQKCPAYIFMSATPAEGMLTVAQMNLTHTCTVQQNYHMYREVRCSMPDDTRRTVATMFKFNATGIAVYLPEHSVSNVTLKDIANWQQRIQHSEQPDDEIQVSA